MIFAVLLVAGIALAKSASGSPAPSPSPASAGSPFTWNGSVRAYYFARTNGNVCLASTCNPKGTPDSAAFNSGIRLHGEYNFARLALKAGATYYGAEPFGANAFGVLGVGYNPQVDNTLPGYGISTLAELYGQYKTRGVSVQTGKEIINTPWANAADSRIVPVAFQGSTIEANLSRSVKLGAMYMARMKSRVTSAFNASTLLTSCNTAYPTGKGPLPGLSGTFTVEGDQCNLVQKTDGFLLFSASYKLAGLSANAYQYRMYDLVDLTYLDASYAYAARTFADPSIAVQYWSNNSTGRALLGVAHSSGYGFELARNIFHNVRLAVAYDDVPVTSIVVPAAQCNGTAESGTKPEPGKIFGGVQDTTASGLPAGEVLCYAGGTASPYTDSYESDPLYTSSIGEGLIDARKGGFAVKVSVTAETENRRLKAFLSQARYNVTLPGTSGGSPNTDIRIETNVDVQYFFNAANRDRPYRGFSLRERLVDRVQTFTPFDFKYVRTQLQFDF